jgi:anaerobic selenocysteine-containing dehydrogenase
MRKWCSGGAVEGEDGVCHERGPNLHLARKAIEPPGEARSHLDIFLDYARRMDFRDRAGRPLVSGRTPKAHSTPVASARKAALRLLGPELRETGSGSGHSVALHRCRAWGNRAPVHGWNLQHRRGLLRSVWAGPGDGAEISSEQYRANDPKGRVVIEAADNMPPTEEPDVPFPFWLTTGRIVYHWHTRTKTGRVPALHKAAPRRLSRSVGTMPSGSVSARVRWARSAPGAAPFRWRRASVASRRAIYSCPSTTGTGDGTASPEPATS